MKITRVGVDLAKNVFQVHGVNEHGKCVWKRRLKRAAWLRVFTETVESGCEVGMEACGGAHHWARELKARGYVVKLMPPQFVKPYVKSQKDDPADAAVDSQFKGSGGRYGGWSTTTRGICKETILNRRRVSRSNGSWISGSRRTVS